VPARYTNYTIKILAPGGLRVDRAMNLICTSDHDVKLVARVITRPYGLEIWDGDRLVAAFPSTAGAKAA
jgi:hypothetical protein